MSMSGTTCARSIWQHAIFSHDIEPETKLTLAAISMHMGDMGDPCYLTLSEIADSTSLDLHTVENTIKKSEIAGWVSVEIEGNKEPFTFRFLGSIPVEISAKYKRGA